jgi:predicted nucleotidyltransferase
MGIRRKIAREAASLLYKGIEKEYMQAKLKAAETLGVYLLPTNLEIALELDRIAEENEGPMRRERLIHMRQEALKLMRLLENFNPTLVGSVWRGTITRDSDIDITVYSDDPKEVLELLKPHFRILKTEPAAVVKHGRTILSFHILLELPSGDKAEITVRGTEEMNLRERREIYGDEIVGLKTCELEHLLKTDPARRFVPF